MVGCGPSYWSRPPDPSTGPQTATVTARAGYPAAGAAKCVADVSWGYQLVAASGTEGSSESIRTPGEQTTFVPSFSTNSCDLDNRQVGLRPGRWRISVRVGIASNSCEIDLPAGDRSVTFTYGSAGCR
jgi:hypothetical protein